MTNDSYEIRIPARLVPAMLSALGIARNTAMMSASSRAGAADVQAEFDRLEDELAAQIGAPGLFHAVDRYGFHDACTRLAGAGEWFWYRRTSHFGGPVHLSLVVDGRECRLGTSFEEGSPDHDRILEILEAYAHVGATRLADVSGWREFDPGRDMPEPCASPVP